MDSVFNTAGRVGFSTLSDHLKRRETVYQVIFIMSIAVCLLQIFTNSIGNALLWAVLAMLFLVNAGYGGPCCLISTSAPKPSPPRTV